MKMLSNTLPAPVQLMRTLADSSRVVKASDVNWAPRSLLKIKGLEQLSARSRADRQKKTSSEFDTSHDNTYREYQSIMATR